MAIRSISSFSVLGMWKYRPASSSRKQICFVSGDINRQSWENSMGLSPVSWLLGAASSQVLS
jgi:hypothetical protein